MPHVAVIIFVCVCVWYAENWAGMNLFSVDVGGFTSAVRQSRIYVKFCRRRFVKGGRGLYLIWRRFWNFLQAVRQNFTPDIVKVNTTFNLHSIFIYYTASWKWFHNCGKFARIYRLILLLFVFVAFSLRAFPNEWKFLFVLLCSFLCSKKPARKYYLLLSLLL